MNAPRPLPELLIYGERSIPPEEVQSTPYRREPYVRVELPDLGAVDAKATRWTDSRVLIRWVDDAHDTRGAWVPAEWVTRINGSESCWRDPYDHGERKELL
ncbi:hypothetical protein I2485_02610 [Nesterenkonia sp. E16_7]|uniref:hypothetical protein n=1 Tax=unclassified Nesterenkonia TaxID=2629769 RepID=UPI001A90E992|nr:MULTISPECIES: hypothetical protein [unclassified Nesterenkonia]MBO0594092.1 hypothetical protein [Nesterenkonia sp. E16_10]MBO0597538.1 hypothetical protein [Nesterenkonia sp. E16_7]